jgi:hypothetical protein
VALLVAAVARTVARTVARMVARMMVRVVARGESAVVALLAAVPAARGRVTDALEERE